MQITPESGSVFGANQHNIFTTTCQTIVNTVNCVGVMGAGIALECRLRYPGLYENYAELCRTQQIAIGKLWIYKTPGRWILNFPTKQHWKFPTKEQYLTAGLRKFLDTYVAKGIESIAFPLLGTENGGLDPSRSEELMETYLKSCNIPVEIYRYDPTATDDLYDSFKARILASSMEEIKASTGLRSDFVERVRAALNDPKMCQLNQLAKVDGIGAKTLEKAFEFAQASVPNSSADGTQKALDLSISREKSIHHLGRSEKL